MNQNDLMAPPTPEELAASQQQAVPQDLMAPPTQDELASVAPQQQGSFLQRLLHPIDSLSQAKQQFEATKPTDPQLGKKLHDAANIYANSFLLDTLPQVTGAANVAGELGHKGLNAAKSVLGMPTTKSALETNQDLAAKGAQGDIGPTTMSQLYNQSRDAEKQNIQNSENDVGKAGSLGLSLAGALTPMGPLSMLTGAAHSLLGGGKTAIQAIREAKAADGIAGAAREAIKRGAIDAAAMAPVGAIQGAANSQGNMFDSTLGQKAQVMKDAGSSALTSGLVAGGLSAGANIAPALKEKLSQLTSDQVAKSPFLSNVSKSFDWGAQGISPQQVVSQAPDQAEDVVNTVKSGQKFLGDQMGEVLDNADDQGIKVQVTPDQAQGTQDFLSSLNENPSVGERMTKNLSEIFTPDRTEFSPMDVKQAKSELEQLADTLKKSTDPAGRQAYGQVVNFKQNVDGILKQQIPGYQQVSDRYATFKAGVPRTIIRGDVPEAMLKKRFGNIPDQDLFTKTLNTIKGTDATSNTINNLTDGVGNIEAQEAEMIKNGTLDPNKSVFTQLGSPDSFLSKLQDSANDYQLASKLQNPVSIPFSTKGLNVKGLVGASGEGLAYSGSNIAGKLSNSLPARAVKSGLGKTVELGKNLYAATNDQLMGVVSKLRESDPNSAVAEALEKSIQNGDSVARNAALFTIMQNPVSRASINGDSNESGDNK